MPFLKTFLKTHYPRIRSFDRITKHEILDFQNYLAQYRDRKGQSLSNSTQSLILRAVRKLFVFLIKKDLILKDPTTVITYPHAWKNQRYKTFDDYLTIFNSNQRRNIKRERNALEKQGVFVKIFTGKDIPRTFFSLMYSYYENTNDKFGPWGCKYLTRPFFEGLYHHFGHRLLFVAAFEESDPSSPLGMSLLVKKGDQLYGRYWGCSRRVSSLHFNTCYYAPIEWAIANGIHRFDPGAGGAHKIRRGFTAISNHSLHRFYDPGLLRIMKTHIDEINRLEQEQIDALNQELPFARQVKN